MISRAFSLRNWTPFVLDPAFFIGAFRWSRDKSYLAIVLPVNYACTEPVLDDRFGTCFCTMNSFRIPVFVCINFVWPPEPVI